MRHAIEFQPAPCRPEATDHLAHPLRKNHVTRLGIVDRLRPFGSVLRRVPHLTS